MDDNQLPLVGAGPIETFIDMKLDGDWIEREAAANPRLAEAMRNARFD